MASESEKDVCKTLADIAAEMRTRSREVKEAFGGRPDGVENMLDIWADRIEAAAKREVVSKKETTTVGNAAAMREALVKIYQEVRSYCFDYGAGESHESLVDRIVDDPPDYTVFRDSILEIDSIVEAALSAPARNCDLFGGDPKMLNTAWFDWTASPSGHDAIGVAKMTFAGWLLAPAAERKGDGDGR